MLNQLAEGDVKYESQTFQRQGPKTAANGLAEESATALPSSRFDTVDEASKVVVSARTRTTKKAEDKAPRKGKVEPASGKAPPRKSTVFS